MRILTTLLILTALGACKSSVIDEKTEGEKLMQLSRDWSKAAATGNIDTTLSYWSDDAIVMSPDQPAFKRKESDQRND